MVHRHQRVVVVSLLRWERADCRRVWFRALGWGGSARVCTEMGVSGSVITRLSATAEASGGERGKDAVVGQFSSHQVSAEAEA